MGFSWGLSTESVCSTREGTATQLQYSYLEISIDRGTRRLQSIYIHKCCHTVVIYISLYIQTYMLYM